MNQVGTAIYAFAPYGGVGRLLVPDGVNSNFPCGLGLVRLPGLAATG